MLGRYGRKGIFRHHTKMIRAVGGKVGGGKTHLRKKISGIGRNLAGHFGDRYQPTPC